MNKCHSHEECFQREFFNVWFHLWAERSQRCQPKMLCVNVNQSVFTPHVRLRVRASHVVFRGETVLFQQPSGPSTINHNYSSSVKMNTCLCARAWGCARMCVYESACFWIQSQHLLLITINERQRGECGDVLIIFIHTNADAHTYACTHVCWHKSDVRRTRTKPIWLIHRWTLA